MDQALCGFYGFSGPPFGPVVMPEQYVRTPRLGALIGEIAAGLARGDAVFEIRGCEGAGKTSLMGALAATVQSLGWFGVTVGRAPVTPLGLQQMIAAAAGVAPCDRMSPDDFLRVLRTARSVDRLVLIVDDAHALSEALFRYLWLLTQPFRFDGTQVSVVLLGALGPWGEVGEMAWRSLRRADLATFSIPPLTDEEAVAYLDHKMRRAGQTLRRVMTAAAIAEVVEQADRCPGQLEALTTFALIEGFRKRRRRVGRRDVRATLHPESLAAPLIARLPLPSVKSAATSLILALTVGAVGFVAWREVPDQLPAPRPAVVAALRAPPVMPPVRPAPAIADAPPAPPARPKESQEREAAVAPRPEAEPAPAVHRGAPGLVLVAGVGDSMATLYARVYRGVKPPPFPVVLAANPTPVAPGSLVVFPEPPGGWSPH